MLAQDRIEYCFSLTHELPDVEFKGPGKGRENPLFGRVVRGAMAMANRRGGGILIIGVTETVTGLSFVGLTPEQLVTWKHEYVADGFNSYTSLPIEFESLEYEHDGKIFLILDIHEFAMVPVMCVKEYRDKTNPKMPEDKCKIILSPGAFYVRTLNKQESKQMLTSGEVHTLIDLANDKAVRLFVERTKQAGIQIAPAPEDKELFAQQLSDWTGPTLEEIRSRGYWDIRIRPVTFQQERLPLSELQQLLARATVNYRDREFPYVTRQTPTIGLHWIGLENQREVYLQAWRFFQSGQFAVAIGTTEDWGDKLTCPYQGVPRPGEVLSATDVICNLTEIYGFASRLATTEVYRDERSVVIETTLRNVQGRRLYDRGGGNRFSSSSRPTAVDTIPYAATLTKEDVIARPRELAVEAASYVFDRFGYNPSVQLLSSIQSELAL